MVAEIRRSDVRVLPRAFVPVSFYRSPLGWKPVHMVTYKLPEEAFCFIEEPLSNTTEAMMTFAGHFHSEALNCPFVD